MFQRLQIAFLYEKVAGVLNPASVEPAFDPETRPGQFFPFSFVKRSARFRKYDFAN